MIDRYDGYANAVIGGQGGTTNPFSGVGNPALDRTTRNRLQLKFRTNFELTQLYAASGLAARIVDMPSDDALARGFEIEGDENEDIEKELKRLNAALHVTEAMRWARLYGGAVIIVYAADGGLLDEPLNISTLQQITELRVYDATDVSPAAEAVYTDVSQPNYGVPSVYNIDAPDQGLYFRVHESRLIFFTGDPLPKRVATARHNGLLWRGRGVLEGCFDSVIRYEAGLKWAERMLERKQQAVYAMEGLSELLVNGMDDQVSARVARVDMVRSVLNTVVIDGGTAGVGGDAYDMRDLNLSGVKDQIEQFQVAVSSDTGMPVTTLFGRSPAGMNATGENDQASYYRLCEHIQKNDAKPALSALIRLIMLQTAYKGARPAEWEVCFNPLWSPSDKEQAEARLARGKGDEAEANASQVYVAMGAITADEVRENLREDETYELTATVNTTAAAAAYLKATTPPPAPVAPAAKAKSPA